MKCAVRGSLFLACACILLQSIMTGNVRAADDLPPPQPFDLVKGLRENDMADLAYQYMEKLAKTPNLPPEVAGILSLEKAKTRLEQAVQETDDGRRDTAAKQAKEEFEAFLKSNSTHPRLGEAKVGLAKVIFLQGKSYMAGAFARRIAKAEEGATNDELKVELARSRSYFKDSSSAFGKAADELEKAFAAEPNVQKKKDIAREVHQARLDQAISMFNIGETYLKPTGKEVDERFNAYKDARSAFSKLAVQDTTSPACWIARAWVIECSTIMPEPKEAESAKEALLLDLRRQAANPAALAGKRVADFFEIRAKLDTVGKESKPEDFQKVRALCTSWLTVNARVRPTTEHYAVLYYHATLMLDEATIRSFAKDGKPISPTPKEAVTLLREAEKEFRKLTETDNDYSARAGKKRIQAIRLIVGDADRDPKTYSTFEELHMAALVQLFKANEAKPEGKKALHKKVIGLLERERDFPVTRENQKEAQTGQLLLLSLYMETGRPHQSAIMAEHMARTSRSSSMIARAGYNAILAYLESASALPAQDTASKKIDMDRAAAMAAYLEKTVSDDPLTDAARYQLALILARDGRTLELFDTLHRISPRFVLVSNARLIQGGAAYELLRYRPPEEKPLLPDARKPDVFQKALTDLNSVLPPPPSSKADEAAVYIKLQLQMAQLHLTNKQAGYQEAQNLATQAKAAIATYLSLQADDKKALALELTLRSDIIRTDAIYGLARIEVDAGRHKLAADTLLQPLVNEAAKGDPVQKQFGNAEWFKNDQYLPALAKRFDDAILDRIVGMTLNCRVRDGDVAQAGELLKTLDKLGGGDIARNTAAIYRLIAAVKPQIETYRKENKAEEAKKLSDGVAALLGQFANSKDNLPPEVHYNLGRAFKEVGDFEKAVEQLSKIPKPEEPGFVTGAAAPAGETEEAREARTKEEAKKREVAALYRGAQIEMIRALRLSSKFDKAEAALEQALGKDPEGYAKKPEGPNKNWGYRFVEFRKERFTMLEAKAEATKEPKAGLVIYVEALKGWEKLFNEYKQVMTTVPKTTETDPKKLEDMKAERNRLIATVLKPRFFDAFYEVQRCRTKALQYDSKGKPPATLNKAMNSVATSLLNLEMTTPDLPDDVTAKYVALLADNPPLMEAYKAAGGQKFLELKPTTTPAPNP